MADEIHIDYLRIAKERYRLAFPIDEANKMNLLAAADVAAQISIAESLSYLTKTIGMCAHGNVGVCMTCLTQSIEYLKG